MKNQTNGFNKVMQISMPPTKLVAIRSGIAIAIRLGIKSAIKINILVTSIKESTKLACDRRLAGINPSSSALM
ncbi:Uncharacterised protein [Vibrio cholerae]|nr:Uncharacterised protein [Vibrio cholerae]